MVYLWLGQNKEALHGCSDQWSATLDQVRRVAREVPRNLACGDCEGLYGQGEVQLSYAAREHPAECMLLQCCKQSLACCTLQGCCRHYRGRGEGWGARGARVGRARSRGWVPRPRPTGRGGGRGVRLSAGGRALQRQFLIKWSNIFLILLLLDIMVEDRGIDRNFNRFLEDSQRDQQRKPSNTTNIGEKWSKLTKKRPESTEVTNQKISEDREILLIEEKI